MCQPSRTIRKRIGAIGAVIVALLWFYFSGLAMLVGAQLNAVIEHASPEGKDPGERVAGEKKEAGGPSTSGDIIPRQIIRELPPPRQRPSEIIVGVLAVAIELAVITWSTVRRARAR